MFKASKAVRIFFFYISLVATLAIWLSLSRDFHWLLYLLPSFFMFAALTGFCPGMILAKKLFDER